MLMLLSLLLVNFHITMATVQLSPKLVHLLLVLLYLLCLGLHLTLQEQHDCEIRILDHTQCML